MTDFTRRRNWSSLVVSTIPSLLFTLNPDGTIVFINPFSRIVLGKPPSQLIGRAWTDFLHVDDVDKFKKALHDELTKGEGFRECLRIRGLDDRYSLVELCGTRSKLLSGTNEANRCFFGSARPYPVTASRDMDHYLDLKLKQEYLKQRIATLRVQLSAEDGALGGKRTRNEEVVGMDVFGNAPMPTMEDTISPMMLTGDLFGMAMQPMNFVQQPPPPVKKTPIKQVEGVDRICTECGTTTSPEWRKGPSGPKTHASSLSRSWV
jgi:hypothetical protein